MFCKMAATSMRWWRWQRWKSRWNDT